MELPKFETQITKTGFVLENCVAQVMKAAGWTVINNRYYVDDHEENVREIDLVGYRVSKVQGFNVYTSLIISCKKSDTTVWALLSRDIDLKNPNSDWWPWHIWTNDKAVEHEIRQPGCAKRYHQDAKSQGVTEALNLPAVDVFAFQEMDRNSGAPKNDKPIFNSIISLMKAQSYELTALPGRKKDPSIYQFNLLSVVDADLLRLKFSDGKILASEIDSEHYIARYIVNKKETVSRIRFIKANFFSRYLEDYTRLHTANCKWFSDRCDDFYREILTDWSRTTVLIEEFKHMVSWRLRWRIVNELRIEINFKERLSIDWQANKHMPAITGPFSAEVINFLNADETAKNIIAKGLKHVYRYEGAFFFDEDIPF